VASSGFDAPIIEDAHLRTAECPKDARAAVAAGEREIGE